MYVRPFMIAIRCAAWGLFSGMRPSEARRRRSKKKISPVERTARTRARTEAQTFSLRWAVPRGTYVGWARERQAPENPDERTREKQEGGAMRVESRACATTRGFRITERARVAHA